VVCLGLAGCSGAIGDPHLDTDDVAGPGARAGAGKNSGQAGAASIDPAVGCSGAACGVETVVPDSAFPRLSHRQWASSVKELLVLDALPDVTGFTNDAPSATGFDNTGGELDVSPGLWQDYEETIEALADQIGGDAARVAKLLPAGLAASGDARAKGFVTGFGERAFRRPLTTTETDLYTALFKQGTTLVPGRDELSAGVQVSVEAMLQSPQFIYRIEGAGKKASDGKTPLTDYEIASRLSYALWDSMPDAALLAAAKAGQLHEAAQIASQASRMLMDRRAADKLDEFHRQLLELRRYDALHPTGLPDGIGAAMRQETERFVHDAIVDHDGGWKTLLTANYSFVNRDLAGLYGLTGTFGTELTRAELDPAQRAGLLTQAGFLTYRSGDTAPILRGVFINLKFLCADLPPPPVFTPPKLVGDTRRERIDSVTGKGTCGETCHAQMINPAGFPLENFDNTGRERIDSVTGKGTCGETCHAQMINPAGFPLENFDNTGRYRSQDNGHAVDATASYPFADGDKSYDGPIEWSQTLAASRQAHECYVRHWLEFGFGRGYAAGDAPLVRRVADASRQTDLSVKQLLIQLVQSPSFRNRVSEAP
jgi:hypothetical protein